MEDVFLGRLHCSRNLDLAPSVSLLDPLFYCGRQQILKTTLSLPLISYFLEIWRENHVFFRFFLYHPILLTTKRN